MRKQKKKSLNYYLKKYNPFVKKMVTKYSKIKFYCENEIISWANMGIVAAHKDMSASHTNINSYFMYYITYYVKIGLKETGYFIKLKSKWLDKSPKIRSINNNITSLDGSINKVDENSSKFMDMMPSGLPSPENEIMIGERDMIIRHEMESLPSEERELLTRHVCNDETFESIAKDMNISKQSAHQKLDSILKKLKHNLAQKL